MKKSMLILTASFLLLIGSGQLAGAQEAKAEPKAGIAIVDATKNNGGFETGKLDPWAPVCIQVSTMDTGEKYANNVIKVVTDPAFASKSNSYLGLQAAGDPKGKLICARVDLRNIQGIDLEKGRTFVLRWDVRNGDKIFTTPIAEFLALTKAGAVVAKPEALTKENAVADKWVARSVKFVMPDTLKEFDSIHLRIGFATQPTEAGATYQGFVDNITLIQSK
ncbi:MAG TPA: hypothetical protein DET40_23260 [Lentisphaeria bacterium]|nr:MAG: hypothetical protein A2X45_24665 [Lentisphaerae bacterium GWF2_50_93]HCE46474.1 hypothetical protein [Lentisphaeria bacterium]